MMRIQSSNSHKETEIFFDRKSELNAFDDTKAGVKSLVDAGITKVPLIFINNHPQFTEQGSCHGNSAALQVLVINLEGITHDPTCRLEGIEQIKDACETWGFFQVVNHGIPERLLKGIIDGVRRFYKLNAAVKRDYYMRDEKRKVMFNTNIDFYPAPTTNWRDTLYCIMAPDPPNPEELPEGCRYKFETLRA